MYFKSDYNGLADHTLDAPIELLLILQLGVFYS